MRPLVTASAMALALMAIPAAAQQSSPQNAPQGRSQAQGGQAQAGAALGRIPVASADSLVGRLVRDKNGAAAGEVEYLLISTTTGAVDNLVIGSAGLLDFGDNQMTAVPWRQVADVPPEGDIRLDVSKSQLDQAPRVSRDALADLTKPTLVSAIIDFYGKPQAQGGQGQQQQQQQQQQQSGQGGAPAILVGREIVTTIGAPLLARPSQMEGATVTAQNGEEVGDIDHVMIDTAHGRVAYLLLARGGFLGMGEEWVPLPLAALRWTPQQDGYRITASAQAVQSAQPLQRQELPARVSVAQLQSLYQHYDVTPYWQQTAQMPEGEGGSRQSGGGSRQ